MTKVRDPGEDDAEGWEDDEDESGERGESGEPGGAGAGAGEHRFRFAEQWDRKRHRPQRATGGRTRLALLLLLGILGLAWWFLRQTAQR